MAIEPTETSLKSRSYVGLVVAQFLAGFNDQAIHFFAIFYATDMLVHYVGVRRLDFKSVLSIVTACFILPFFLFSPTAGVLADKFSKRNTIVFWKIAEIGMMGVALAGFLLPHLAVRGIGNMQFMCVCSSVLVVSTVFMMGMHSTFFTPAKYGIMPELLHTSVLSRGNGMLEGLSFIGQILGTVFGGLVYGIWHSTYDPATGVLNLGQEWLLGTILFGLAILGALAAWQMAPIPAAAPDRPFVWQPWVPLKASLGILRRSRPLVLATVGISFFTFMTLFVRQTLLFDGETSMEFERFNAQLNSPAAPVKPSARPTPTKPATAPGSESEGPGEFGQDAGDENGVADRGPAVPRAPEKAVVAPRTHRRAEFSVALLIAFVSIGVGAGCGTAGFVSGDRIELGLVPFGALLIILLTALLACALGAFVTMRILLVGIGYGAGLYIVPLYTLLQHRAPKDSKGSLVALSNFLNVTGGLIAVGVFFFITYAVQTVRGLHLSGKDVQHDPTLLGQYVQQLAQQTQIPRLLFIGASLITVVMLYLLCRQRPDFLLRALSWFRLSGRRHLHAVGLSHIPSDGPLLLATNCHSTSEWTQVMAAIDRGARALRPCDPAVAYTVDDPMLEWAGRRLGLFVGAPTNGARLEWDRLLDAGHQALAAGNLVGLALDAAQPECAHDRLLHELRERHPCGVLPVRFEMKPAHGLFDAPDRPRPTIVIGRVLPLGVTAEQIRAAMAALDPAGQELQESALH